MVLFLGIETSCDDTGVALMKDTDVLGEVVSSQERLHSIYGGVVPEIASRAHMEALPCLFETLLERCEVSAGELDVVCVARGPGLMGSLLVGLSFAKGLVMATGATLVGVNHLHAHLLSALMEGEVEYPAMGLLISGGHTHLYLVNSPIEFVLLGRTLDDAVGEAFDKVARLLNLPYPGGKFIDMLATRGEPDPLLFSVPYVDNQNLNFSFSGIKTAVLNHLKKYPSLPFPCMREDIEVEEVYRERAGMIHLCASFNHVIAKALTIKFKRAISRYPHVKSLIVAGGVAANSIIRRYMEELARELSLPLFMPPPQKCTDNGLMIAFAGRFLYEAGLCHGLEIDAVPRGRPFPEDFVRVS